MPDRNADKNYNTNLASEYLVMSMLSRAGKEAYLSLGNKKGVDIIVKNKDDTIFIVEVKGVNKKTDDWIISNSGKFPQAPNLLYALVSFDNEIQNINGSAVFWLIPSSKLAIQGQHKISKNNKTIFLSHKSIRENYAAYKNNFDALRM